MNSLLALNTPTFDELVKLVQDHYQPPPSERYIKIQGKSIFTELQKLAEDCNYGDSLDEMLQDHLVCGVQNE